MVPGGHELVPRRNVLDLPQVPSGEECVNLGGLDAGWLRRNSTRNVTDFRVPIGFVFQSIPGQEDLSLWFEEKMSNPEALHEEFRNRDTKLRTLIHGDLWHNNIFFKVSPA